VLSSEMFTAVSTACSAVLSAVVDPKRPGDSSRVRQRTRTAHHSNSHCGISSVVDEGTNPRA
jgi:hypothetical protein